MNEITITCLCGKHKPSNFSLQELREMLDNAIFPSKEDDGIEHVDMSYAAFNNLICDIIDRAMFEGAMKIIKQDAEKDTTN